MSVSASSGAPSLIVNGLPGAMGVEIAQACLRRGLRLAPFALTGPGQPESISVDDGNGGEAVEVRLFPPEGRDELAACMLDTYGGEGAGSFVCIDFTHPSAVNGNAEWYSQHGLPFVMGTTGGDRDLLHKCVDDAGLYCVIAPNMAKQIVALQAALERMATDFPGAFSGYALSVAESHQSTKADTSGTAKAISAHLATLTAESDFTEERIERVRDPDEQLAGGGTSHRGVSPVPDDAIDGHAYHTYSMLSADGKVEFQVRHNVQGRSTYAEGTVDAAVFLSKRMASGTDSRRRFNMIDVLKAGEM